VQDFEALSPLTHPAEPVVRGPIFEQLLDHLDPVFAGQLPPNAYVFGPQGSGKSAVITALFKQLNKLSTETRSVIHTTTRARTPRSPGFVCVDARETTSEFAFYHAVLDALVEEPVAKHGISTNELRVRLHDVLRGSHGGIVVAVDHIGEPNSIDVDELLELFTVLSGNASWIAIGRADPGETDVTEHTATSIHVEPYRQQMLVDMLMSRASTGLAQQALDYDGARRIARWAEGNAHDALAALLVAVDLANRTGPTRLTTADIDAATDEVPRPCVSLGRVLSLPANRQVVLRKLVDLDPDDRASVTATTEAIGSKPTVDLSAGTVKRFLYEMANIGIVDRVKSDTAGGRGRPPSRVELRFPPTAFRRLYDLRN
jgi:Cdc6-like AAA superfamily ATPase